MVCVWVGGLGGGAPRGDAVEGRRATLGRTVPASSAAPSPPTCCPGLNFEAQPAASAALRRLPCPPQTPTCTSCLSTAQTGCCTTYWRGEGPLLACSPSVNTGCCTKGWGHKERLGIKPGASIGAVRQVVQRFEARPAANLQRARRSRAASWQTPPRRQSPCSQGLPELSLAALLLPRRAPDHQLPEEDVRFYVSEVLLALQYLHLQGFIYR